MSTIVDVAKKCNVSVATVSRVLNGSDKVTQQTKDKVQKAIDELNYCPNMLGRNLRTNKTNMILVMLPTISNNFYSKVVEGINDSGAQHGYNIMLCTTGNNDAKENTYLELMRNNFADGIIHLSLPPKDEYTISLCEKYAFVQCSEYSDKINAPYVSVDNEKAAFEATSHLIEMGYKRIALLRGKESSTTKMRGKGYADALKNAGFNLCDEHILDGNYDYELSYKYITNILKSNNPPDAVFAMSDVMAMAAANAAMDTGLLIPEEFGVVGFDNIFFAESFKPGISTISQPRYELGKTAFEMLLEKIEGKKVENKLLEHKLVVRKSSSKR